jgi:hypothetical protein
MTPEQFNNTIVKPTIAKILDLGATKGKEYGKETDRLANFSEVAGEVSLDPLEVWYVFASKHYRAITSYIREKQVYSNEPIEGRIDDMIVYLLLLKGIIHEQRKAGETSFDTQAARMNKLNQDQIQLRKGINES